METEPRVEPVYGEIGKAIRSYRDKRGVTQADLAKATGLTRTSIVNIEQGRQRFMVHTLLDVARALRVGPEDLLSTTEDAGNSEIVRSLLERQPVSVQQIVAETIESVERGEQDDDSAAKDPGVR